MRAEDMTRGLAGRWFGHYGVAACPAHDDRTPSLSISDSASGRLLLHCHAGCDHKAVREAVAVKLGSFGNNEPFQRPPRNPTQRKSAAKLVRRIWSQGVALPGTSAEAY